jgi:uncharacterized protein (TIRG00374 family)
LSGLLRLAVALGLLGYLFTKIPVRRVAAAMTLVDAAHVGLVFAIALVGNVVASYRLKLLAAVQGIWISLRGALDLNLAAMFYGLFVPGGNISKAAVRTYKLGRPSGRVLDAGAVIVADRLAATAGLGFAGQVMWLIEPTRWTPLGIAFFIAWMVPAGLYLLSANGRLPALWSSDQISGEGKWRSRLRRLATAVDRFTELPLSTLSIILSLSLVFPFLTAAAYYVVAAQLGIDISYSRIAYVSMGATLLTIIPISLSGLGIREGALVYLLASFGVPGANALALSLVIFAGTVVLVGLLGGVLEGWKWIARRPGRRRIER